MFELVDFVFSNANQPFVLKGGTALMRNHGLDRVSEDVDLDGVQGEDGGEIFDLVAAFAAAKGGRSYPKKDTPTTKRVMFEYREDADPIKVEVSYRPVGFQGDEEDGNVYTVDELCRMKCSASSQRTKLRDMYDLAFICVNHYDSLSTSTKRELFEVFRHKGIEHVEASVKTAIETDSIDLLIDIGKLDSLVFDALEMLGLRQELDDAFLKAHEKFMKEARMRWQARFGADWVPIGEARLLGFDGQCYGVEVEAGDVAGDWRHDGEVNASYDEARSSYERGVAELSEASGETMISLTWHDFDAGECTSSATIERRCFKDGAEA